MYMQDENTTQHVIHSSQKEALTSYHRRSMSDRELKLVHIQHSLVLDSMPLHVSPHHCHKQLPFCDELGSSLEEVLHLTQSLSAYDLVLIP